MTVLIQCFFKRDHLLPRLVDPRLHYHESVAVFVGQVVYVEVPAPAPEPAPEVQIAYLIVPAVAKKEAEAAAAAAGERRPPPPLPPFPALGIPTLTIFSVHRNSLAKLGRSCKT